MNFSNRYIVLFAASLCLALSLVVSTVAVSLKDIQDANKLLDKQTMVLRVAGLIEREDQPTSEEVATYFETIDTMVVDTNTGELTAYDPNTMKVDPRKDAKAKELNKDAEGEWAKRAAIKTISEKQLIYLVRTPGKECVVFPIYGNGLWSTLYGFFCLKPALDEVVGIIYYEQKETAGLGGEVENPRWLAQWPGKKGLTADGDLLVEVVKNGKVVDSTTQVDGISGSTITSLAVTYMLEFWFSEQAYGKALDNIRQAIN
ncbi:MAG: NADH:ubiquinone reductase (Na(+)-transporting) subunit C [Planctomycetes bacterium]|nr:NADH:ubiquinone reductase (Na(+)-transporting) subunit C [Planctomycetota bacterium]